MIEKAPPAGWVVQVTVAAPLAQPKPDAVRWVGPAVKDAPSFQYFNVAIAAADKAIEATKTLMAKANALAMDWETGVVRGLSSAEIGTLDLKAGEVKPA
jgi:hypothetical protein